MNQLNPKLKAAVLEEHKTKTSVLNLSKKYNIPRSTIYRWINADKSKNKSLSSSDKEIKKLLRKINRLQETIQIINETNCLPSAPLKERLYALEKLQGKHNVHVLCEALQVDRGTFYNHIFRNKKTNTWYAQRREELRIEIQKIFDESKQIFGAGKITAVLKERGFTTSAKTVRYLMSDMGLISIRQRAKALYEKDRKANYIYQLKQNFVSTAPN